MTSCPQSRLLKSLLVLYLCNTCYNFRVSLLSKSVSPAPRNSHACGRQRQWQECFLFSSLGRILTLPCICFQQPGAIRTTIFKTKKKIIFTLEGKSHLQARKKLVTVARFATDQDSKLWKYNREGVYSVPKEGRPTCNTSHLRILQ